MREKKKKKREQQQEEDTKMISKMLTMIMTKRNSRGGININFMRARLASTTFEHNIAYTRERK